MKQLFTNNQIIKRLKRANDDENKYQKIERAFWQDMKKVQDYGLKMLHTYQEVEDKYNKPEYDDCTDIKETLERYDKLNELWTYFNVNMDY